MRGQNRDAWENVLAAALMHVGGYSITSEHAKSGEAIHVRRLRAVPEACGAMV